MIIHKTKTGIMKNFTVRQSQKMMLALIDLTQSHDETVARRARSGLFEAEVLSESDVDLDGGVMESKRLWDEQKERQEAGYGA